MYQFNPTPEWLEKMTKLEEGADVTTGTPVWTRPAYKQAIVGLKDLSTTLNSFYADGYHLKEIFHMKDHPDWCSYQQPSYVVLVVCNDPRP